MRERVGSFCGALLYGAALAAPIRGDQEWAIHPQLAPADWQALAAGRNLAGGRAVTYQPAPNYSYTADPDESGQLTDGQLAGAEGRMWTDKRAVGWAYTDYVRWTLDIGEPQPVGRVIARFQVLSNENTLPRRIALSLSLDGECYSPARSLIARVHPEDNPAHSFEALPTETPGIYAVALAAGCRARYVRLDFTTQGFLVCDELAVMAAEDAVQELPPAPRGKREYLDNVFDRRDHYAKLIAPGNLLAGKPLRYAPAPTYPLTTDAGDPVQLTDGKLGERVDERIWFEQGAVCWHGPPLVTIFADLGEDQPVQAVVLRLLGGAEQGSLNFPDELRVLLSQDGKDYDLVAARHKRGLDDQSAEAWDLPEGKLAWVHNFVVPVGQQARYLAVQIRHQDQFAASDEMALVKGAADLPVFQPSPERRVVLVTDGIAFFSHHARHPIAAQPLRTKVAWLDARIGTDYNQPATLVLDLPETARVVTAEFATSEPVSHDDRPYSRCRIPFRWGRLEEFQLQSLLPPGRTDTLFLYGDAGKGLANERRITWESVHIEPVTLPKRLHVSLAWSASEWLYYHWPNYLQAMKHLGFNAVACFPRYWKEADAAKYRPIWDEARQAGLQIIVNESPAGALEEDRKQGETKSQLPAGPGDNVCPSYRGQFYQKELASFAQHAVWCPPDYIFYDIEAYWNGAYEADRCERCGQRFAEGRFRSWDEFRAAIGREIHVDIRNATEKALADAGLACKITYGSYRTEPMTPLNDGLFGFDSLYPELLQLAMPSLYVAGNQMAVAANIAANRARMRTNDIVPWLSTGCYGEYEPAHTRDMILEALANGARGITYYCYGDFDPLHFKYHAEAIGIVAPIEDVFADGKPLTGLSCSRDQVKVCGMGQGSEMAVLVSNYRGVAPGSKVTIQTPAPARTPVWDLHAGKRIGKTDRKGAFTVRLDSAAAHLYYLGSRYAAAVRRE
jgi:hypothetical protein